MTPPEPPFESDVPDNAGATPATVSALPVRPRPASIATTPIETAADSRDRAAMSANLLHVWNILVKWRWPIAAVSVLGLAAGAVVTVTTTPIYRATTTIQIDMEPAKVQTNPNQPYFGMDDPEKYYLTQYELLKSRSLAERVVQSEDLADDQSFLHPQETRPFWRKAAPAPPPSGYATRAKSAAGMIQGGLTIDPVRASRLVKISYQRPGHRGANRQRHGRQLHLLEPGAPLPGQRRSPQIPRRSTGPDPRRPRGLAEARRGLRPVQSPDHRRRKHVARPQQIRPRDRRVHRRRRSLGDGRGPVERHGRAHPS